MSQTLRRSVRGTLPCMALLGALVLFGSTALAGDASRIDVSVRSTDGAAKLPDLQSLRPDPVPSEPNATDTQYELTVQVGKTISVTEKGLRRVAVGNPSIADLAVHGPGDSFELSGIAPGKTAVIVWHEDGSRVFYRVTVQR